jgi:hypothetical protein
MIKQLAIPLTLAAAAALAGCAGERVRVAVTDAPAVAVVTAGPAAYVYPNGYVTVTERSPYLRPGFGRVDSVVPVYFTTGVATGNNRLRLVMEDGSVQVFDVNGPSVAVGAWVQVTPQYTVMYPVASR